VQNRPEARHAGVLLEPIEEQLDLPALLVDRRHRGRVPVELVGEQDQVLAGRRLDEADAPQRLGKPGALGPGQPGELVLADARRLVDGVAPDHAEVQVLLGPRDEGAAGLAQAAEPG